MKLFLLLLAYSFLVIGCNVSAPCNQLDSSCNPISALVLEKQIRESRNVLFFAPSGGKGDNSVSYKFDQFVTITAGPASSVIRYTTDGSTPTCSHGTIYSTPVPLTGIKTYNLRAAACNGNIVASTRNDNYTITVSPVRSDSKLRFWYAADSLGLENGSEVKIWKDLSGNENHLYASTYSLSNPAIITNALNGKPSVRFTSTQRHYMNTKSMNNYSALREGTGVIVLRKHSTQSEEVFFSIGTLGSIVNARNWRGNTVNPSLCSTLSPNPANCAGSANTAVPTTGYHVIIFSIDSSSNVTYYYDGVNDGNFIPGTQFIFTAANLMTVGTGMNLANYLDAEILELLFFEQSFTSAAITTINCIVQNKYGLTVGGTSCQ